MDQNLSNAAKIRAYVDHHSAAVLGTINDDGTPHGSVVYICALPGNIICFATKNQTQKYMNLIERPNVSLTIADEENNSTLQSSGRAAVLQDPTQIDLAMEKLNQIHAQKLEWLPPLSKLRAGSYALIGIQLAHARLAEYQGRGIGNDYIFTEL